ncbi:ATP-binding cassette domain-containing protein [Ensifer canadensis]
MQPLLKVEGLKKSFGGVAALRDGRLELQAGSVHALCGGNGAGKSTFLSILMGIQQRDGGTNLAPRQGSALRQPRRSARLRHRHHRAGTEPRPHMTVAENIYLGREPSGRFGGIDFKKMNRDAQQLLDRLEFGIRATQTMMTLSVAQMQLVEIAKAFSHEAEVIFMDEPTSAIGEKEAQHLFAAVARLKAEGKGVVYVSHRLSEIFQIADSYTVFRDGGYVGSGLLADIDRPGLIKMIVGRELAKDAYQDQRPDRRDRPGGFGPDAAGQNRGHLVFGAQGRNLRHLRADGLRPHGNLQLPVRPRSPVARRRQARR